MSEPLSDRSERGLLDVGDIVENTHGARFRILADEEHGAHYVAAVTIEPARTCKNPYPVGEHTSICTDDIGRGLQVV